MVHVSSGNLNPITLADVKHEIEDYTRYNPFYKPAPGPVGYNYIENEKLFQLVTTIRETIPIRAMDIYSRIPMLGSARLRGQVKLMKKVSAKMHGLQTLFHHFINNSWTFETQ